MTAYPSPLEQRFDETIIRFEQRMKLLEMQLAAVSGSAPDYVCTAATHPSSAQSGWGIYETDTRMSATFDGSEYLYTMKQVAPTQVVGTSVSPVNIDIPAGLQAVEIVWSGRNDFSGTGGSWVCLQFNGDTASHYLWQFNVANNAGVAGSNSGGLVGRMRFGIVPMLGDLANSFGNGRITINNVSAATYKPVTSVLGAMVGNTNGYSGTVHGVWESTAPITSIQLIGGDSAGNWVAGSTFSVYGVE